MQVFWQFVCDHYHAIIELVLLISVLFVTIFKKKVNINSVFEEVLGMLPYFIVEAESKFTSGQDKFGYVFNRCIDLIQCLTHQDKSKILDEYTAIINTAIENILTTPQKKER